MNPNSKLPTLIYFTWFMVLRLLVALNVSLSGLFHPIVHTAIFLALMSLSFILQIRSKIFSSWYKQLINVILELSLVTLGLVTLFEELFNLAPSTRNYLGLSFIVFFMLVQVSIAGISGFEIFHDCCAWIM
jgi:hypothetical protein